MSSKLVLFVANYDHDPKVDSLLIQTKKNHKLIVELQEVSREASKASKWKRETRRTVLFNC